ncbi:hypothetical protein RUM43_006193, partial [Polyplax serrata]
MSEHKHTPVPKCLVSYNRTVPNGEAINKFILTRRFVLSHFCVEVEQSITCLQLEEESLTTGRIRNIFIT